MRWKMTRREGGVEEVEEAGVKAGEEASAEDDKTLRETLAEDEK